MHIIANVAIWFILTSQAFSLNDPDYVPVGCFKDKVSGRALPEMLANFRIKSAKWPEKLNWNDLEGTVVKKCAAKAKSKWYSFFGIQFYGECWSGSHSQLTYDKYGRSSGCTNSAPFVGKSRSNYVYMLTKENECQNYKILNTADRSQFHKTSGPGIRCDQNEIDPNSWYRFTGAAGNAMADTCVQPNRCQTMRTGWFDGKYPEVADGIQEGHVCFSWMGNCCEKRVSIKIRNCWGFFVYKLQRNINCMNGYCGNGQ